MPKLKKTRNSLVDRIEMENLIIELETKRRE